MMHAEFVFLKLLTMAFGLLVAYVSFRGYSRYHSLPLLYVSIGFVFISVGAALEGLLFEFTSLTLYRASLVNTGFMVLGMGCILYSIYGGPRTRSGTIHVRE